jgi:O-acetyl-ADP-ribose deacetylase (regulator of RNase III)
MWERGSPSTPNLGCFCYASALREAFALMVQSVALPIFGMGGGGGAAQIAYSVITRVLRDLDELKASHEFSVKQLRFLTDKTAHVEGHREALGR